MGLAEKRLVTCLFVDIVGSTELVGRIGAERMKRVLDEAFTQIRDLITAQGGTIEKYMGDAVFVLFGAPIAHANDAERALRAAEACVRWTERTVVRDVKVAVRVGVEMGEALVDLGAVEAERQRMAVGTSVNLAARLQQVAQPGQVLVGPDCHEATVDVAEFEDLGSRQLKGLGVLPVWRLIRVAEVRPAPTHPFVGRRTELERLRSAYARARSDRATLALVIGPPGQGKTRLAEEFVREVRGEARLLQARCRPGGEIGAWTPLKQLLAADVADAAPASIMKRIGALLEDSPEHTGVAATVAHSAGLLVDDRLLSLRPSEREQEIAQAWGRYFSALCLERPLVVWIEDVHWAEDNLVRLVDRLTLGQHLPLLVLMTGRPEFAGTAILRPGENRVFLELERLDPASARALGLSAGGVDEQAIERAEGHPLFIIELARSRLVFPGNLPVTVQAAIGARLDELEPRERELLQRASVVGETFSVRDAALLNERDPADVAGTLGRLAHLRYLHPFEEAYRFHHILVRDVAYGRLPIAERMRLHARYAQEGVDPEDVEALSHHWWEALCPPDADWVWDGVAERDEMRQEALRAHLAAAHRISDRFNLEGALQVYRRALTLARDPIEVATIEAAVGLAYARDARGDEAWEHRLSAIAAYREAEREPPASLYADMLEIPTQLWGYFRALPPEEIVLRLLHEGQQVARATHDTLSLARLLVQEAQFGSFDPTLAHEAVRLAVTSADPAVFADVLQWAAAVYLQAGEVDLAGATYERMDRLVEAGGRVNHLLALMWRTVLAFVAGDLPRAEALAVQLREATASANTHWRTHATGAMGLVRLARGDWAAVETLARETAALVASQPDVGFCLIGAAAFAYGAMTNALARKPLPEQLTAFIERCVPESAAVRASTLLMPRVMAGEREIDPIAREAWRSDQRLCWNRQIWDPVGVTLAIALTILERWDDLEAPVRRLEEVSRKGGGLCGALAAAIREEMAAARSGPAPRHATLRELGYRGLSELLSFRPGTGIGFEQRRDRAV